MQEINLTTPIQLTTPLGQAIGNLFFALFITTFMGLVQLSCPIP